MVQQFKLHKENQDLATFPGICCFCPHSFILHSLTDDYITPRTSSFQVNRIFSLQLAHCFWRQSVNHLPVLAMKQFSGIQLLSTLEDSLTLQLALTQFPWMDITSELNRIKLKILKQQQVFVFHDTIIFTPFFSDSLSLQSNICRHSLLLAVSLLQLYILWVLPVHIWVLGVGVVGCFWVFRKTKKYLKQICRNL